MSVEGHPLRPCRMPRLSSQYAGAHSVEWLACARKRLRRVQHEWRQAARVIVDEKVVFEKVDKDFPKDQLDWTSNETAEPILPSE